MQDNLARAVLKGDFLLKFTYPTTYKTIVSWVRIPLPPSTPTASLLKKKNSFSCVFSCFGKSVLLLVLVVWLKTLLFCRQTKEDLTGSSSFLLFEVLLPAVLVFAEEPLCCNLPFWCSLKNRSGVRWRTARGSSTLLLRSGVRWRTALVFALLLWKKEPLWCSLLWRTARRMVRSNPAVLVCLSLKKKKKTLGVLQPCCFVLVFLSLLWRRKTLEEWFFLFQPCCFVLVFPSKTQKNPKRCVSEPLFFASCFRRTRSAPERQGWNEPFF